MEAECCQRSYYYGPYSQKDTALLKKKKKKSNKIRQILFHLHEVPRIAKFVETESRPVVASLGERGNGSYWLMGTEFHFDKMKNF